MNVHVPESECRHSPRFSNKLAWLMCETCNTPLSYDNINKFLKMMQLPTSDKKTADAHLETLNACRKFFEAPGYEYNYPEQYASYLLTCAFCTVFSRMFDQDFDMFLQKLKVTLYAYLGLLCYKPRCYCYGSIWLQQTFSSNGQDEITNALKLVKNNDEFLKSCLQMCADAAYTEARVKTPVEVERIASLLGNFFRAAEFADLPDLEIFLLATQTSLLKDVSDDAEAVRKAAQDEKRRDTDTNNWRPLYPEELHSLLMNEIKRHADATLHGHVAKIEEPEKCSLCQYRLIGEDSDGDDDDEDSDGDDGVASLSITLCGGHTCHTKCIENRPSCLYPGCSQCSSATSAGR